VKDESITRDGGALVAWRESVASGVPFTQVFVGDIEQERADACASRLRAAGAPATPFPGPAEETIVQMVARVPKGSLCMAYVDPYNLQLLSFPILQALASVKVDLAINFSTMDLQRNAEFEFDPARARFDGTAPGWRDDPRVRAASKGNVPLEFFRYWRELVEGLGFTHSREMPLVHNDQGRPIYRMVFFARHDLPIRIWSDIARGPNRTLDFFGED
jgi:three-Cys-motif partner protein